MTDVVRASSARRRTAVGRALVLAGLGAGFWLLGQTVASADEGVPSVMAGDVLAAVGSGTPEGLAAATSTAVRVVSTDVVPEPPAVVALPADVATAPAGHLPRVQQAVHVVRDVPARLADPAERIGAVADAAVDVIRPVVETPAPSEEPVALGPVLDLVRSLLGEGARVPLDGLPSVDAPAASTPTGATAVAAPHTGAPVPAGISAVSDEGPSMRRAVAVGAESRRNPAHRSRPDVPSPQPGSPASAPSRTACADSSPLDQMAAHPPALAAARGASACPIAAGADEAAGGLPLDPSSSPD